ncbi:MAG: hypothetical protein K2X27_10460 [Candidatus Obscuribacterales bacterium]|nr:hypothetical protein [Candidatus Obscuribacterales bacterium]
MRKIDSFVLLALLALTLPAAAQAQQNRGQYVGNPTYYGSNNSRPLNPYGAGGVPLQYSPSGQQYRYPGGAYPMGTYPYANNPGFGYYGANPYVSSFPALGAPVPLNGGFFRFNVGGFSGSYWKSPSGYYYPWGAGALYTQTPPVIVVEQGASQPTQPPVTAMLSDMSAYIEEQNSKKKFKSDDYQHLSRRVRDLQSLESTFRTRNGGTLDPADEDNLRKSCAMLSGDISRRVIP